MISEKTVELNLTAELLAWLYGLTGHTHFVVAPTQRAEGKLGFDAGFYGPGPGVLIQFKRAHVRGSVWCWQLNRTKLRDQHRRLQRLDAAGIPVFYAFPHFHRVREIVKWRRQLLVHTFWIRPSSLNPPGGPTGHHDLFLDASTKTWRLTSPDPIDLNPDTSLGQIGAVMERTSPEGTMEQLMTTINAAMFGSSEGFKGRLLDRGTELDDLAPGLALVGRGLAAAP